MHFTKQFVGDVELQDKRILLRVDFNVPMKHNKILNNQRIVAALETIEYIVNHGAWCLVVISHMGRPGGVVNKRFTLKPVAKELEKLLKRKVTFLDDCIGVKVEEACACPEKGSIFLLENLRFHPEEEGKLDDPNGLKVKTFKESLRKLGDIYVNDAYATAHRSHSSMLGEGFNVRVAGFLLRRELETFTKALENPKKPFLAILGGGKVKDKIPCINKLLDQVSEMIICGGMSYTFLKVLKDMEIGNSVYDAEGAKVVKDLMEKAKEKGVTIHFPIDFITADKWGDDAKVGSTDVKNGVPENWMALDIGAKTRELFREPIVRAKLIVWNGPPCVLIFDKFNQGTLSVLEAVAEATANGATSLIGGGDTAASAAKWGMVDRFTHVSSGGGVNLELLQGIPLPGVAALSDAST